MDEYFLQVNTIAQVMQFTPDITKTSARLEAKFGEKKSTYGPRLSRWDAMHLATAISYRCSRFLTLDDDLFQINFASETYMPHFVKPIPVQPRLQFEKLAAGPQPP